MLTKSDTLSKNFYLQQYPDNA